MLRVVENSKPQSRPEIFDNSAKLDLIKKEGNPDFESLVIARPTELIERLLPRFDSSCKKLIERKTDEKESLDSECNSIIHAKSMNNEIANNPAITLSPDCDSTSHSKSMNDGVITDSVPPIKKGVNDQNTESKFEISKYNTQKERDELLLKLLCENRERRKSIVSENANALDIENKCTLQREKVDGGGETPQPQCNASSALLNLIKNIVTVKGLTITKDSYSYILELAMSSNVIANQFILSESQQFSLLLDSLLLQNLC
jgi:hypothetical protein